MNVYQVVLSKTARAKLKKLDRPVSFRILKQLKWFGEHLDEIPLEPLRGDLRGAFKYRIGHYRVLFDVDWQEHLLLVQDIDHRSRVYKRK